MVKEVCSTSNFMHLLCIFHVNLVFFSEGLGDLFPDDEMRTGLVGRLERVLDPGDHL
jgi:hypothetical protein